jgi:hypothetical protein
MRPNGRLFFYEARRLFHPGFGRLFHLPRLVLNLHFHVCVIAAPPRQR